MGNKENATNKLHISENSMKEDAKTAIVSLFKHAIIFIWHQ